MRTITCVVVLLTLTVGLAAQEHSWRGLGSTGVFPAKDLVIEFWDLPTDFDMETLTESKVKLSTEAKPGGRKNIVWRTTLPHWGHNAPVVMGDQVYVLSEEGWQSDAPELVCIDVVGGEILWQRPVDHLDAWPKAKGDAAKQARAIEIKRWREHFTWWNKLYWNNETDGKQDHDQATWDRIRAEALAAGWQFCDYDTRRLPKSRKNAGLRGRYGRKTSRDQGAPVDASISANFDKCGSERIYFREGWTSEGPWYGSTMGSVVTDGSAIYAMTALGGLASYTPDGERRWVSDIGFQVGRGGTLPCHDGYIHTRMSSPVLADGLILYYDQDSAYMYAHACVDGKLAWKTRPPGEIGERGKFVAQGHRWHMAPGGTPVVMDLGGVTVVVTAHGAAFRVQDGALLGQVKLPVGAIGKGKPRSYGATYNSWTAAGDVLYANNGPIFAVRLGVEGDALTQEMLWQTEGSCDASGRVPNLVVHQDHVYVPKLKGGPMGDAGRLALDRATGKPLFKLAGGGHWSTCIGVGGGIMVAKAQGLKAHVGAGHAFAVCSQKDGSQLGIGVLCGPLPTGDVQARHIAFQGLPTIVWGAAGVTCWGNRIFIRSNDYLWCVGDPQQTWVPPEQCSP